MSELNHRWGTFSSSSIADLMSNGRKAGEPGAPFYTYLKNVKYEKRAKRALNKETSGRAASWGTVIEKRAFDLIPGFVTDLISKTRYAHPTIENWTGAPDLYNEELNLVGDIKCPYTLLQFIELVDSLLAGTLKQTHKDFFWQLVSNAILCNAEKAQLVVYMPYKSELDAIREFVANIEDYDLNNKSQWIYYSKDEDLPYLEEEGEFDNLNVFDVEITNEDKAALEARVKLANQLLNTK